MLKCQISRKSVQWTPSCFSGCTACRANPDFNKS